MSGTKAYLFRRSMLVAALLLLLSGMAAAQTPLTRIASDDDDNFPADVTRIGFEKDAAGNELRRGQDVSKLFVDRGVVISTSVKDSFVGVQTYQIIASRSRGKSIATDKPLYQGVLTIRFCKPGDAAAAATVTVVGFWIAHVSPDGTSLQAFDAKDRLIGSISTTRTDIDFLAVKSTKPIAYIKVVPDEEIDPDYAIDDLVFDRPKPISR